MAARKAAPKSTSKEVATWDEELAKMASIAAGMEANTGGGSFFSTRGGQLSFQDSPMPDNEMAVIILDTIFENVYYEGRYDPDTPQSPTCFAFGRVEEEMAPHIIVTDAGQHQSDKCEGCEHNEFGSAIVGRGKACRNTRRLAMIPAGQFARDGSFELFDDPDHYAKAEVGYMKLPVTSVKGYAMFVKQVASAFKRPPFGVVARVAVVPDAKTQFKVTFEALEKVDNKLLPALLKRHEEVSTSIDFPYSLEREEEKPVRKAASRKAPASSAGRASGKSTTRAGAKRKY